MELYIIRHGQSTNNVTMLYNLNDREHDPPLTDLGQQQARTVADYLANHPHRDKWTEQPPETRELINGFGITKLYCSPMRRALQTCLPISQAINVQPEVWIDLHEHGGMFLRYEDERGLVGFPGMARSHISADFPGYVLPPAITEQGWWKPDAGEEDIAGAMARAVRVAHTLRKQATSAEHIGLVTHGTFADCLIKALLNFLPGFGVYFSHYNTGISRLDFRTDDRPAIILRYTNRVEHLSLELMS